MSGPTITGEARLDNRNELLRALEARPDERAATSDIALILKAHERWGEECPGRLLGDFAFVVRDDRSPCAFGARDHLGVMPFYYRSSGGRLAFATLASGIPAMDGLPLELDEARVADVLVPELEGVDRTSTFYRGVWRLPPGHRLRFEAGRVAVAPFWAPDPSREVRFPKDDDYVDAFREILTEAVRCRLTGPVASMLSGGLDSSAIVGFARSLRRTDGGAPLAALSAMTADPFCEESRHIRLVLGLPGLRSIAILPDEVASFRVEIGNFLASMEEPFDASMILPLVMYAAAGRNGFRAVLDGVDGDCVASHEPDLLASLLRAGSWRAALREARGFARFYRGTYAPWSSTARLLAGNAGRAFAPAIVREARRRIVGKRAVDEALADSIVSRDFAARIDLEGRLATLWAHRGTPSQPSARERQAREIAHPHIAAAVERYHRVAATQGVEARHPFLDRRVVDFCLALPWDQKVHSGWSKLVLRRATAGLLPGGVRWRRGRWVRLGPKFLAAAIASSGDLVDREMSSGVTELAPYVDIGKLKATLHRYRSLGDPAAAEAIWTASALSSWLRETRSKRYHLCSRANGPAALPRLPLTG